MEMKNQQIAEINQLKALSPRLRIAEVCAILKCSRDHVYALNRRGLPRKYNEGLRFSFWLRDEVMAYAVGKPLSGGEA